MSEVDQGGHYTLPRVSYPALVFFYLRSILASTLFMLLDWNSKIYWWWRQLDNITYLSSKSVNHHQAHGQQINAIGANKYIVWKLGNTEQNKLVIHKFDYVRLVFN